MVEKSSKVVKTKKIGSVVLDSEFVPRKTIVCVCAHSDDQIFGPGGSLAKFAKEGARVITIILSYGEFSQPHIKDEIVSETRVKEAEKADKIIGGEKVVFYGLKEGGFIQDAEKSRTISKLKKYLVELNPEKILTHASDDPHPDHRATCKLVKTIYDDSELSCPVYTFDVWTPFSIKKRDAPKWVVDISDTFSIKLKALKSFKSQLGFLGLFNYYVYFRMLVRNFFDGLQNNYKFAEVFYKLR